MKKQTRKRTKYEAQRGFTDVILNSVPGMLICAVLAIVFGLFFIWMQKDNKPIGREEAVFYSGSFEEYEVWSNYRTIHFADGAQFEVYPHTETVEFRDKMKSLPQGTVLYIAVNPNNKCVIEIKTENEELLNFEESQAALDSYDNGYIAIGCVVCAAGVFLAVYAVMLARNKKKEKVRRTVRAKRRRIDDRNDAALRRANRSVKCRILLEATVEEYKICYRRVKSTNELVINGTVYDEIEGIVEFEHDLTAMIDGHKIEAGYSGDSYSYIMFDGELIAQKRRWI